MSSAAPLPLVSPRFGRLSERIASAKRSENRPVPRSGDVRRPADLPIGAARNRVGQDGRAVNITSKVQHRLAQPANPAAHSTQKGCGANGSRKTDNWQAVKQSEQDSIS
jgi:hypothetical protein